MKYGRIEHIDQPVSRVIMGCAGRRMLAGEDADDILDAALEAGINTFDTAENYKRSEESLGRWLAKGDHREKSIVITKGCHPYLTDRVSPRHIRKDLEQSLKRLKTDHVEIYLLHRDDLSVEVGPLVEELNACLTEGKIRAFGGSNWTAERIREANAYALAHGLRPFTVSSPNYGICEQVADPYGGGAGCVTCTGSRGKAERDFYRESQMPLIAYSGLGSGLFSGKVKSSDMEGAKKVLDRYGRKGYLYPVNMETLARVEELASQKGVSVAQLSIAWCYQQGLDVYPVMAASSARRVFDNAKAADLLLTKEEADFLKKED